jgi:ubiquinone biosynthesis monooxygenase Coq7
MHVPPFETLPIDRPLVRDLRSDHAGEVGAVEIYRGMLAATRSPELKAFADLHLETEVRHRRFFDNWLPWRHQSRVLWLWRAAGWLLGALSALLGTRAAYQTVAAVETFVERHYDEQLQAIAGTAELEPLRAQLEQFCREEVEHQQDASRRLADDGMSTPGRLGSAWSRAVGGGSALGVAIARRI